MNMKNSWWDSKFRNRDNFTYGSPYDFSRCTRILARCYLRHWNFVLLLRFALLHLFDMISTIIPRCFQTVIKILFPLTLITLSFETSISPLGNPRIFDCRPSPGEGNLNRKWQVFPAEDKVLSLIIEGVTGKEFTFAGGWLRRRGLQVTDKF